MNKANMFAETWNTGGVVAKLVSPPRFPPNFQPALHPNIDIAIWKLSTVIEESDTISFATLPVSGWDSAVNSTGTVAGWPNKSKSSSESEEKLRKVIIPIRANEDCSFSELFGFTKEDKICAGAEGKDSSKGDSGGPLIDETGQLI
ncbi:Peptidase cysteine/serine, trypsin-like protein, partial [Metarhizium brunneum]